MTHRNFGRRFILCAAAGVALTGSAHAAAQKETFRDWQASLDEVNTGEDVRKTCSAATTAKDAAGKDWTLKVSIGNGDVMPPDAYPAIAVSAAGGGLPSRENQPAAFGFGDQRIDAKVSGGGNEAMAMAAGSTLDLTLPAKPTISLSLSGFTAAYRKLGTCCGFPTTDIAK
jgi:hypothetical protein